MKITTTTTHHAVAKCSRCKITREVEVADDGRKGFGPRRLIAEALRAASWLCRSGRWYCAACSKPSKPAAAPVKSKVDVAEAHRLIAEGKTLEEVGEHFGVSKQRVHQLLNQSE